MYRFFALLILSAVCIPAFAERTVVTRTPYYNQYYAPQAYYGGNCRLYPRHRQNNSVFHDINDLERYALNRNFTKDSDIIRLERLETMTFGAVQEGDIYTRYDNVRNAILSKPKHNYKTSLLRSMSNYFNGQLTGYTPPVSSPDIYPYGSSSYSEYVSPWGRGFKTSSNSVGSGAGIHFLDD